MVLYHDFVRAFMNFYAVSLQITHSIIICFALDFNVGLETFMTLIFQCC